MSKTFAKLTKNLTENKVQKKDWNFWNVLKVAKITKNIKN
jgi:hypothetical protein